MSDRVLQRVGEAMRRQSVAEALALASAMLVEIASLCVARGNRDRDDAPSSDALLTVDEAAHRLGTTRDWVYRHAVDLPFTVRVGRHLRFSASGIADWVVRESGRARENR